MNRTVSLLIHGALAGAEAAACMTVLRMAAHRAGWIRQMPPQAVEVWAARKAGVTARPAAAHHVADQLIHLGYGATFGALYAASLAPAADGVVKRGLALGVPLWAFGSLLLFPALGIGKPAWHSRPVENLVNVAAHALYGVATALLTDEFEAQKHTQPRLYAAS